MNEKKPTLTEEQLREVETAIEVSDALRLGLFFDWNIEKNCLEADDINMEEETLYGKEFYKFILDDVLNYPASKECLDPIKPEDFQEFLKFARQNGITGI